VADFPFLLCETV